MAAISNNSENIEGSLGRDNKQHCYSLLNLKYATTPPHDDSAASSQTSLVTSALGSLSSSVPSPQTRMSDMIALGISSATSNMEFAGGNGFEDDDPSNEWANRLNPFTAYADNIGSVTARFPMDQTSKGYLWEQKIGKRTKNGSDTFWRWSITHDELSGAGTLENGPGDRTFSYQVVNDGDGGVDGTISAWWFDPYNTRSISSSVQNYQGNAAGVCGHVVGYLRITNFIP